MLQGNWSLYEDRLGKPGFISTGPRHSSLEFQVAFGAKPRISLVYDRSYEGFGQVRAKIVSRSRTNTPWTVSANRTDGVRVTQTDLLFMGDNPLTIRWKVRPFTNSTLRLTFDSEDGAKFKIRFLSSC